MVNKLSKKNDNKSLFLYTALIFTVAILFILISFFSQKNLEKKHNEYVGGETTATSISEKTAQLSEENMLLFETARKLNNKNDELEETVNELTKQIEALTKNQQNTDLMIKIYKNISKRNYQTAEYEFSLLDVENLTEEQEYFYNHLKKTLQKNYK